MGFTRILESDRVKADRVNQLGDEISAELTSAIGQIANDRGYITSKNVNQANINTLVSNGKFINMAGMPATGSWVVDVISLSATFVTQYASCIYDSQGLGYTGKKLVRDNLGGTWGDWKEIATTESYKLQASDMLNGWTFGIDENDLPIIIKSGKIIIINALLKAGVVSIGTPIFSIPERFLPSVIIRNNFYKTASLNYAEFTIIQGSLKIYNYTLATNDIVKISIQYDIE